MFDHCVERSAECHWKAAERNVMKLTITHVTIFRKVVTRLGIFRPENRTRAERQNGQCDNYNRCNNMSRINLSGYVGHVTIFSWMFTIVCCLVVGLELGLGLGLDVVSGWKVVLRTYFCAAFDRHCHTAGRTCANRESVTWAQLLSDLLLIWSISMTFSNWNRPSLQSLTIIRQ